MTILSGEVTNFVGYRKHMCCLGVGPGDTAVQTRLEAAEAYREGRQERVFPVWESVSFQGKTCFALEKTMSLLMFVAKHHHDFHQDKLLAVLHD